ncbi:MAG TPA: adenine phosphoribosyltransferase [Clostridiales bacterium]|jgi:adenine phosphoribosyltransferase|nr:adenine phosphoribosyltransferase [Clostridiales bacterium]
MDSYLINVAGLERSLKLCRISDDLYIAAFIMFGDVELNEHCAKKLLEMAPEHDYIITAEAKSIPLVYEMARLSGKNKYFIARKGPKLYMTDPIIVELKSITTERTQKLYLDRADAELMRGKRVLIVDDVISTGESLRALETLVNTSGGIIAGKMAVLAEGDAMNRSDIKFLAPLPLFNAEGKPL